jgi:hypothetical protein
MTADLPRRILSGPARSAMAEAARAIAEDELARRAVGLAAIARVRALHARPGKPVTCGCPDCTVTEKYTCAHCCHTVAAVAPPAHQGNRGDPGVR